MTQDNPNLPGFRAGPFMDTPTMLMHIKSGGKAKRLNWEWAYLVWNNHKGPQRGDQNSIPTFSADDWTAKDWVAR